MKVKYNIETPYGKPITGVKQLSDDMAHKMIHNRDQALLRLQIDLASFYQSQGIKVHSPDVKIEVVN